MQIFKIFIFILPILAYEDYEKTTSTKRNLPRKTTALASDGGYEYTAAGYEYWDYFFTYSPTLSPGKERTPFPTKFPTNYPTVFPTLSPRSTKSPSLYPTLRKTRSPLSKRPSKLPTKKPTKKPSLFPTTKGTKKPSRSYQELLELSNTWFRFCQNLIAKVDNQNP